MTIGPETKILDLGGGTGAHIASVLNGRACIVTIADVSTKDLEVASANYGFQTVQLSEGRGLPFSDGEFDIVFCSSVIEHVTGEKEFVYAIDDSKEFRTIATLHQKAFAEEIERIAKGYFVQTPYRYFPIESHSWLPWVIVHLSRKNMKPALTFFGKWWPKRTKPDWFLLVHRDLRALFPRASVHNEWAGPFVKSIMAIKSN